MSSIKAIFVKLTLSTYKVKKVPLLGKIWDMAYDYIKRKITDTVSLSIHGFKALQPAAYTYPFTSRLFKNFNNPLVECVYQNFLLKGSKITVVDIGAAIGDTVFLLKANCNEMVNQFYCIDGDDEFFSYLDKNMSRFTDVKCFKTILSDSNDNVGNLVRIHAGTASALGDTKVQASSLDSVVLENEITCIDVLKIDVDGYDGKVLAGSKQVLTKFKPTVIFEWHPVLCANAGTSYLTAFKVLSLEGFDRFIWFHKSGEFSHFMYGFDQKLIEQYAEICLKSSFDADLHYDVVALHQTSFLNIIDFANSNYSRNKVSNF